MYDDSFKTRYRFAPVAIYENDCGGDTKQHIHSELEIVLICEGSVLCTIGEHSFRAQKGDMIFANPFEVHAYETQCKPYRHQCICLNLSLIADPDIAHALGEGAVTVCHCVKQADAQMLSLFRSLYHAVEGAERTLLLESTAYVSLLFACLDRCSLLSSHRKDEKAKQFCKEVLSLVSQHYADGWSSKDMAERLFYTQSYFCRTFKALFGVSFSAYLNMYRIQQAKQLLINDNCRISQIAGACGFQNTEYFNRLFKKQVGMTPLEYKKSI